MIDANTSLIGQWANTMYSEDIGPEFEKCQTAGIHINPATSLLRTYSWCRTASIRQTNGVMNDPLNSSVSFITSFLLAGLLAIKHSMRAHMCAWMFDIAGCIGIDDVIIEKHFPPFFPYSTHNSLSKWSICFPFFSCISETGSVSWHHPMPFTCRCNWQNGLWGNFYELSIWEHEESSAAITATSERFWV